jgi:hypothetical protein
MKDKETHQSHLPHARMYTEIPAGPSFFGTIDVVFVFFFLWNRGRIFLFPYQTSKYRTCPFLLLTFPFFLVNYYLFGAFELRRVIEEGNGRHRRL